MFGLSGPQVQEAGAIMKEIAEDWRGLVAGSEGFLTGPDRWGLYRQEVVWGEMVCVEILDILGLSTTDG